MPEIVPLARIEDAAVEALLDRAFGPDRRRRTAYMVRGPARAIPSLSFAAVEDAAPVGTIQCWPVAHRGDDGVTTPLMMVGPVAVAPERQRDGIGRRLMETMLAAAAADRLDAALMLIGDPDYYARLFAFTAERTAAWRLPGPIDRHRLLARGDDVPAAAGELGPA